LFLTALAFGLFLALAPVASAARLTGYDLPTIPGATGTLIFKATVGVGFLRMPLPGQTVEFSSGGQTLGTAQTAYDGLASIDIPMPTTEGDYTIQGELRSFAGSARGELLLSIRSPGQRFCVVDLSGTIQDGSFRDLVLAGPRSAPPVQGAAAALTDIAKDATILYFTGEDDYFAPEIQNWLAYHRFPRAPVVYSKQSVMAFYSGQYKAAVYQLISQTWTIGAGFGDQAEDLAAAQSAGAPFVQIGAQGLSDWDAVRAANAQGGVPGLGWATQLR
jgi:hypothetical protein